MTATLDRLLARYEYGRLAPELFDIELRVALEALTERSLDLDRDEAVVRLWSPALLAEFQLTWNSVVEAIDWGQFRDAVRGIHQSRRNIATIGELLHAASAADRAEEAVTALHDAAELRRLQRLPAVAAAEQIVDLARATIIDGHYTRASRIAAICSRMAAALLERRDPAEAERERVRTACEEIRTLCDVTSSFAPPDEGDACNDGSLAHVERLVADGYVRLALRLVAELEMALAGRRRFLALYRRQHAIAWTFGGADEIRRVVAERSWDGAFDYYCEAALAGHARTIGQQRARTAAAASALEAELTYLAHPDP